MAKSTLAAQSATKSGSSAYEPDRGDIVWLDFDPHAGHEQAGRRPALVLSPKAYNVLTHLVIICPITTQIKGNPFEVRVPAHPDIWGAILVDQVKSLDWHVRRADPICTVPKQTVVEVLDKLKTLIGY